MSTPARVARSAVVDELTPGAASVSEIVTPRKPSSPRSRSVAIRRENTAGRAGSNAVYVAFESITSATLGAQRRYGSRSARRAAQAGEVLERRVDAGTLQAVGERARFAGDGARVRSERARPEEAAVVDIGDRREIRGDPEVVQRAAGRGAERAGPPRGHARR